MSVRKASSTLRMIPVRAALAERAIGPTEPAHGALDWHGPVRLVADRAVGISAALRQQQVRTGLLERALVLGADHREGAHGERPEAGRRLLAHFDALGEAGLTFAELCGFAEDVGLEQPGTLWILTLLFGCLELPDAEEAFEAWIAGLEPSLFHHYGPVLEIAEALALQPNPALGRGLSRWALGPDPTLAAVALERLSLDALSDDLLLRVTESASPLVQAATERLIARAPAGYPRALPARSPWINVTIPALAWEMARARLLQRDLEPMHRLRDRDARALAALGSYAVEVVALAGDGGDDALIGTLARGLPSEPRLLDALGRVGLPSLFPRLLADLGSDDHEEDAHRALTTMLGPHVARPSPSAWEAVIAALPASPEPTRLRGGRAYARAAVLGEMSRPDLSELELRARADELFVRAGRQTQLPWGQLGVSLEGAIAELGRFTR